MTIAPTIAGTNSATCARLDIIRSTKVSPTEPFWVEVATAVPPVDRSAASVSDNVSATMLSVGGTVSWNTGRRAAVGFELWALGYGRAESREPTAESRKLTATPRGVITQDLA